MKRVVVITPPPQSSGGIGRMVQYESREWEKDPRFSIHLLDSRGRGGKLSSLATTLRAASTIRRLALAGKIDGAHINLSSKLSAVRKLILMSVLDRYSVPYVVHLHGSGFDHFFGTLPPAVRRLVSQRLRRARKFVVLGDHWRHFSVSAMRLDPAKVVVVPNAAPGPCMSDHTQSAITDEIFRVLFAGRIGPRKGSDRLLSACALLKAQGINVRIVFAGDGDLADLRSEVAQHGLADDVEILGWVSSERVHDAMMRAHVLALPSTAENQPISIIEAMAHSLPVVAGDVGAVSELVSEGKTGYLIDPLDVNALADRLMRLTDRAVAEEMGVAARQKWEKSFNLRTHWNALSAVWVDAFGGHR